MDKTSFAKDFLSAKSDFDLGAASRSNPPPFVPNATYPLAAV